MYIHLLFREGLSASGQMIASISSWKILMQSAIHLLRYIIWPSHNALPPLGSTSIIVQNCHKCLRQSRELELNGDHVFVLSYSMTTHWAFHTGIMQLLLGLQVGMLSSLMQLQAVRQLYFLGTPVGLGL